MVSTYPATVCSVYRNVSVEPEAREIPDNEAGLKKSMPVHSGQEKELDDASV
jgi:hypothetical protein